MIQKYWSEIRAMAGGASPQDAFDHILIRGVSTDSRTVEQGNLFVPLEGARFDGHEYVKEAMERGAAGVFWRIGRAHPPADVPLIFVDDSLAALQRLAKAYRDQLKVRIIGVTGSNGKTTTKDMTAAILSTTYKVLKTEGNLNNHIGLPLTLLKLDEDTDMAVIEMGMSGRGEIALLSGLASPEAAIITNIGESHLLQLGSREEIAKAKLEILSGLREDGLLVYNGDEPLLERFLRQLQEDGECPPQLKTFRFGAAVSNDFYPLGVLLDHEAWRTYFALNTNSSISYDLPMLGRHNAVNALAAIAVSKYMGVSDEQIRQGLKHMKSTGMRIEVVKGATGLTILNDAYNASPTSMKAAISLLGEMKGYDKRIVVLGDMLELGSGEEAYHREIGAGLDPERIDYVVTFGRLAHWIAEEARKNFAPGKVIEVQDRLRLAALVARLATAGDAVLFKASRGMKLEEIVDQLKRMAV